MALKKITNMFIYITHDYEMISINITHELITRYLSHGTHKIAFFIKSTLIYIVIFGCALTIITMTTRLERNIREDYLTCTICLNIFFDPRQLTCGHSYCIKCLTDYTKTQTMSLVCPTCRAEMKRPESMEMQEWIQKLPQDQLLVAIINAIENNLVNPDEDVNSENISENSICEKHQKKNEYFCFRHKEFVCDDCIYVFHSKCDFSPISNVDLKVSSLLSQTDSELERELQDIAKTEQNGMYSLAAYQSQQKEVHRRLTLLRENFEKFSHAVFADLKNKMDMLNGPEVDMKSTLKTIQISRDNLEQARTDISTMTNGPDTFSNLKFITQLQENANDLLERVNKENFGFPQYQLTFQENEDLTSMMKKIKDVGILEVSSAEPESISITDEALSLIDPETEYLFYRKRVFDVNEDIHHQSSLSGCCIFDTFVIITDQCNNCVLKIMFDGTIVEKFPLQEPHQVCRTEGNRLAITCWDTNRLVILDTEPNCSIVRLFGTSKHYLGVHGVGYDRLVVTSLNSPIDVISTTGEILFSIDLKRSRNFFSTLFRGSLSVPIKAIMNDNNVIAYDSAQKSLVCMDFVGKIIWQKTIPGISCFACGQDDIYCTLSSSNKVIVVGMDGTIKDLFFLKLKHPWSIDVDGLTILITEDSPSGKYTIIQLK